MDRPNLLVFLTDDHGAWAGGFAGNREINSPTMDYLARTGVRMREAFTPCPVCSPARSSFWTGKIPSGHGIHDHIGDPQHPGITGQTTLAQRLEAAGYETALCGKWHGHATGRHPQPGFSYWFSQWGGTAARFGPQPFSENGNLREYHGHQAPLVTDAALRFLRYRGSGTENRPFFLFVGYTETHSPFSTLPERLVSKYRQATFCDIPREPFSDCHGEARTPAPADRSQWLEQAAQYYAAVELIDSEMGRLLDALEGMGQLAQTVVVYTSDHGHMNGQHGLLCKGNATTPQNFLEESIRIPLLARGPGISPQGAVLDRPVDHCDLHATLLDLAKVEVDPEAAGPGRSFRELLAGHPCPDWRSSQVCEYGNARMIRSADGFKLIRRWPGPNGHWPDELYDLRSDPRETTNLARDPSQAERVESLKAEMDRFFSRHESPARSGIRLGETSPFNRDEPWRRPVSST